ncbi:hypothetical protein CEXT_800751 [Caerostris extrusa]|uniref:Uncharacterized protein n=1 Tax=Caerostris extrusa TaxID=172846 RepID=A0AAV4PV17_CAEEX|nr:hypothetical protein CEXT_800751 [Caerostris extrusa]
MRWIRDMRWILSRHSLLGFNHQLLREWKSPDLSTDAVLCDKQWQNGGISKMRSNLYEAEVNLLGAVIDSVIQGDNSTFD